MMGAALMELEHALTSQKMTAEEANALYRYKYKARSDFFTGALAGAGLGWAATSKLSKLARINLAGGLAACFGFLKFDRSMDTCIEQILGQDGSRMQKELANILVKSYRQDPWALQLMCRHFYLEQVFDDSNVDTPVLRWRHRNFFSDNVAYGQRAQESYYEDDLQKGGDSKRAQVHSKHVPINFGAEVVEDPLDTIFGHMAPVEEIDPSSSSSKPAIEQTRHRKRSHRRRRHHRDVSSDLKNTQPWQV